MQAKTGLSLEHGHGTVTSLFRASQKVAEKLEKKRRDWLTQEVVANMLRSTKLDVSAIEQSLTEHQRTFDELFGAGVQLGFDRARLVRSVCIECGFSQSIHVDYPQGSSTHAFVRNSTSLFVDVTCEPFFHRADTRKCVPRCCVCASEKAVDVKTKTCAECTNRPGRVEFIDQKLPQLLHERDFVVVLNEALHVLLP